MKTLLFLLLPAAAFCQPLSQGERDRAMSELHATRKQFLDAVAGLSPAQWNFKPSAQAWSIAEIASHLAVGEDFLFQNITRKIMASPAQPEKKSAAQKQKDEMVLKTIPDRTSKRQSPPEMLPDGRSTPEATVAHFRASRDRTIAYIQKTQDDLRAHFATHRVVGEIDAYQFVLVMAAHTARHVAQIEEVKAGPRYPRAANGARP